MIDVGVVVVNYNGGELIVDSLNRVNEPLLNIHRVVVDNGSTDGSDYQIEKSGMANCYVMRLRYNAGFSTGVNEGVRYLISEYPDIEYVFLLNPDALLNANDIYKLVQSAILHNCAVVSPQIIDGDGNLYYAGGEIDTRRWYVTNLPKEIDPGVAREVSLFNGGAALIKAEVFLKLQGLNQLLFMYFDEAEFSCKLQECGYSIYYEPAVVVRHFVSYSTRKSSFIKSYYMARNRLWVFRKISGKSKYGALIKTVPYFIYRILFFVKHGMGKDVWFTLKGILHFLNNRMGNLHKAA